jgi:hypothetical protein
MVRLQPPAIAILAKSKEQLVAAGQGEAAAAQDALGEALIVADALAAIFRAAQTRLLIAAAAAAYGARLLPISPILAPNPGPQR